MNKKLVYNNFNFNKFGITDEEFTELSDDTKYKHLQDLKKKNELRKLKPRTIDGKKQKLL